MWFKFGYPNKLHSVYAPINHVGTTFTLTSVNSVHYEHLLPIPAPHPFERVLKWTFYFTHRCSPWYVLLSVVHICNVCYWIGISTSFTNPWNIASFAKFPHEMHLLSSMLSYGAVFSWFHDNMKPTTNGKVCIVSCFSKPLLHPYSLSSTLSDNAVVSRFRSNMQTIVSD